MYHIQLQDLSLGTVYCEPKTCKIKKNVFWLLILVLLLKLDDLIKKVNTDQFAGIALDRIRQA